MLQLRHSPIKFDSLFVLSLFTVFAATAILLVLIGAKQYQTTINKMDENYEVRTATSYILQKVRQFDSAGSMTASNLQGTQCLSFTSEVNQQQYTNYIYSYDGFLRELSVSDDSVYSLGAGEKLIPVKSFTAEYSEADLLYVTITTTNDKSYPMYIGLTSNPKKESP